MKHARVRILTLVLALLGIQLTWFIAPAYACGCGAMVPDPSARISVAEEQSVLRWDGRQEQIVMRLTVNGDAHHAAWIMPVPHRAAVRLGDPALFDQLAHAIQPVHRTRYHFWPRNGEWPFDGSDTAAAAPPAAGAVGVVDRQRLGPFDVARLTATDPAALGDWLHAHGFSLPARLKTALQPYVDRHWEYVAVRLAPDSAGTALHGALDPIHLTFAANAPVYPMRLSRLASLPQSLGLYVLAAHRMRTRSTIGGLEPEVVFAGRLRTHDGSSLGELTAGTPYLTALTQRFPDPTRISGDHELRRAAADTPVQQVVYEDELREVAGIPLWLLTVGGFLLLAGSAVALIVVRRSRRPVLPPPPVQPPPPIAPSAPLG
ncbi:hypothetical protein GCM10010260_07100 [Streptomyces filipinensis]|uniref:DUF2330 domain-containing protein n=1 Tax=Streptomyces filipinensis TaxID=66887 RepID=A0A918I7F0_9ACTN|nr:DUF2330 domain-containing protein [Streptomyces filipinensis]GGU77302.1 hypothetical protein GCM10010260_07100 [Streptomyces filipinensis]